MSLTSWLYKLARLSADGRAIRRGPAAVGRRMVRKPIYRATNRLLARSLRNLLKG